jgi:hypothetical protein
LIFIFISTCIVEITFTFVSYTHLVIHLLSSTSTLIAVRSIAMTMIVIFKSFNFVIFYFYNQIIYFSANCVIIRDRQQFSMSISIVFLQNTLFVYMEDENMHWYIQVEEESYLIMKRISNFIFIHIF